MRLRSIALALICAAAFSQQPPSAVIGFLEDHSRPEDIGGIGLRVVFMRQGAGWIPAMADPSNQADLNLPVIQGIQLPHTWEVTDHGKAVGPATTEGWSTSEPYGANGLLRTKTAVSFAGKRSTLYGGWAGGALYAPMLAFLGPVAVKTASWHPSPARSSDLKAIWQSFQKAVPKVPRCDSKGEWIQPEPDTEPKDAEVTAAFDGLHGNRLICAHLREDRLGPCDGVQDRAVSDFWFLVLTKGKVQVLATPEGDDALTLTPLDFTQVEGDAIAVFLCSGYNRDGYILYYDGFRKSTQFFWSYH